MTVANMKQQSRNMKPIVTSRSREGKERFYSIEKMPIKSFTSMHQYIAQTTSPH
ncbi:unnamed protein product [Linum tenue]|uniref:Uncharacterized protein n=1 Tax=Linum tenue TaxID=586396 RepID=A0AAV0P6Z9_9ROSI|nr:unnamed protein product [Linum tenue]